MKIKVKVKDGLYEEDDFLKDCPNYRFIPLVLPAAKRVIAIGDIHGDIDLAKKSFRLAGLIDDKNNWIGRDTIVVQVGDQIDSCRSHGSYDCRNTRQPGDSADDMTVLEFFNEMHKQASNTGGAVYSLLGNHELMNSYGRFDYVSFDNLHNFKYKQYQGEEGRKQAFQPGGPVASMMACTRPSILIIGSSLFVHAGILPVLAQRLDHLNLDDHTKLKYLNSIVRKWLLNKLSEEDLSNKDLFLNTDDVSPFWTRVYGAIPENEDLSSKSCSDSVKNVIEVLKLGQIVVGHTPQLSSRRNGINGTCYVNKQNKLYRIDGGFSKAFKIFGEKKFIQVLEIIDDKVFNIITGDQT